MKKADAAGQAEGAPRAKRGYSDLEVNVTGGYDPTSTLVTAPFIQAQVALLKRAESIP